MTLREIAEHDCTDGECPLYDRGGRRRRGMRDKIAEYISEVFKNQFDPFDNEFRVEYCRIIADRILDIIKEEVKDERQIKG